MGTTAQKLQRILETKIGFKDLITEKGGVITETTTFHEYIDEARKLMDGGSVIVEEGGPQPTAVPNEGYVDKIYFNTKLTSEEVDEIITNANLDWIEDPAQGIKYYGVAYLPNHVNSEGLSLQPDQKGLTISILDFRKVVESDKPIYTIMMSNGSDDYAPYMSPKMKEYGEDPGDQYFDSGWFKFKNWEVDESVYEIQYDPSLVEGNCANTYEGMPVGLQNETLKELISITPFSDQPATRRLTGTYKAVAPEVTDSGEIDLTEYWNNQQMPVKVNVNIEAGASGEAIEVATEEEMDAVLVEENIGKFYKFTGESTDKYEKDIVYVVQDADNPIIEEEIKNIATEEEMDAALVTENIGKFFMYTGETTDKYISNIVYIVQDSNNTVIDGPAIITKQGSGTQPVPNEGHVEKIYFNTDLTVEDVDRIIANANLPYILLSGTPAYVLCAAEEKKNWIMIVDLQEVVGSDEPSYWILDFITFNMFYASGFASSEAGFTGWNPNLISENGAVSLDMTLNPLLEGVIETGTHNALLKELVNIGVEPSYSWKLSGDYEAVELTINSNKTINLTDYTNEEKIPTKLTIDVPSSLKRMFDQTKSSAYLCYENENLVDASDFIQFGDTENVEDASCMFSGCSSLKYIPLMSFNHVTSTDSMFKDCSQLQDFNFYWNLPEVTNTNYMFYGCTSLTQRPEIFTPKAEQMCYMYGNCINLKVINHVHTESATSIAGIFAGCENLEIINGSIDLSNMESSLSGAEPFDGCEKLTKVHFINVKSAPFIMPVNLSEGWYKYMIQECIKGTDQHTIKISSKSPVTVSQLNDLFVRFTDPAVSSISIGEKGEVEFCNSTDDRAMTVSDYMALKNWSIITA